MKTGGKNATERPSSAKPFFAGKSATGRPSPAKPFFEGRHRVLKGVIAVLSAAAAIIILSKFLPDIVNLAKNPDSMASYLASYGFAGFLVFILLEIIQVVIAVIPGDFFHIAAGFMFKMPLGFFLAYTGEMLGAVIAFALARILGRAFINKFIAEERIDKLSELLNSTSGIFGTLVLCLIPGIPKDMLIYVAGITPVKPARFLTVFLLCRIPDIFIKAGGGAAFLAKDYGSLIIIIASFALLTGIGLILKKRFMPKSK